MLTLDRHRGQELKEELDIDVRVLGIASSSRMLLSEEGIDLSGWKDDFSQCAACICTECRSLQKV